MKKKNLFLVVIGGRAEKANVELHDVRWVVGSKIEDTYEFLRRDWFGSLEGLHIDSYKKINHIDGYNVDLKNLEKKNIINKELNNRTKHNKNLWFVNIGGYSPKSMQEQHEFGLVVASSKLEAKKMAKSKWLVGCEKKHNDDISSLKMLFSFDNCRLIKKIGKWEIKLTPNNNLKEENNYPDWYGYKRIDLT